MMSNPTSRCPHVATIGSISKDDYQQAIEKEKCDKCEISGTHLWVCLREECLFVGCGAGKEKNDHSSDHEKERAHPLQLNLTTKRIWCYSCQQEILANNDPPLDLSFMDHCSGKSSKLVQHLNSFQLNVVNVMEKTASPSRIQSDKSFEPTFFELEHSDSTDFTRGIAGLYNLGNTCYMNSALQALSNCVPLTSYFLDLTTLIVNTCHRRSTTTTDSSPAKCNGRLAKSYLKLMQSMWIKPINGRESSQVLNPSSIAAEIRSINPSFRSYTQQDAQEFLRCFMDELHSELRSLPLLTSPEEKHRTESSSSENSEPTFALTTMNVESEYETCSSELNETLSDEEEEEEEEERRTASDRLSRTDSGVSLPTSQLFRSSSTSTKRIGHVDSIISSIFDGSIQSEIECLTCNRRSKTLETFQDLSLPIPSREQLEKFHSMQLDNEEQQKNLADRLENESWVSWFYSLMKNFVSWNLWSPSLTLQDCLQAFFQADELTGDNMYSCDKCGKLRNGVKYSRVVRLPEVLCIHLKRFRHDSLIYTKIGSYVSFPLVDLEMRQFLHKDCRSEVQQYDLFSCIVHYGRAGSGHYVTYALNHLNQQWYEYDDETVRQVDANTVQNAEAYVLFYRKKESNSSETYETIRHLLNNDEESLLPFYVSRCWINRLFYFAEPGPITHQDFLCKHGGVSPAYWSFVGELVCPVPESVWEYLSSRYGGSSGCNILYPCRRCQLDEENLKCRQREEKRIFLQFKRAEKESDGIYALSPTWYRDWENFVCEKSSEIPGPISNGGISSTKNGQTRLIRRDCNHLQISESIWTYLHSIYGGGPPILLRSHSFDLQ